jgi:hypothetical protein
MFCHFVAQLRTPHATALHHVIAFFSSQSFVLTLSTP